MDTRCSRTLRLEFSLPPDSVRLFCRDCEKTSDVFQLILHMSQCHPDRIKERTFVEDVDLDVGIRTRIQDCVALDADGKQANICHVQIEHFEHH